MRIISHFTMLYSARHVQLIAILLFPLEPLNRDLKLSMKQYSIV